MQNMNLQAFLLLTYISNKVTDENLEDLEKKICFLPYSIRLTVHSVHHIICTLDKNILFSMVIKYANI